MGKFASWMARLGFKVLKPVAVSSIETTREVVFKTVRMFVGGEMEIKDDLSFADRTVFEDDDPADIAQLLEKSFQVRVPRSEYLGVYVVGDMVCLFERYRSKR